MQTEHVQYPISVNESEAIVDSFWDESISALSSYALNSDLAEPLPAHCNPRASNYWCWAMLKWDRTVPGRPIMVLSRPMNVDISAYDRLIVRLAAPEHITLRVDAVIDGGATVLIDGNPGGTEPKEHESPISGARLQQLTLTLTSARDQADEVWLYWIAVANEERRVAMLARPNPFNSRWDGFLLPPEAQPDFKPRFGFFFDAEDLPAIRRRAASPAYRPLMEQLRARVRTVMSFHKSPEDQIGQFIGVGIASKALTRVRDWDTFPFTAQAPLVAFVGLIDKDPEMLRFAARIAVSAAHIREWLLHFFQGFPGSTWDGRAFPEAFAAAGCSLALDWAGSWFTDKGEHLIRYAVTHKALGRIRGTLLQYDYMWDCNQTHLIGLGRLLALLVQLGNAQQGERSDGSKSAAMAGGTPEIKRGWARTSPDIDQFERDLYDMIDRYVHSDGSSNEGVGYWGNTFRITLPVLALLARHRGKPLRSVVPPKLNLMWNFLSPVLSTGGEPSSFLPISDTSFNVLPWDVVAMAAVLLDNPGWQGLLAASLKGKTTTVPLGYDFTSDGTMALIFGPDEPVAPVVNVPAFRRLPAAGMITSNRPWINGTVRMHLVGAMPNAGHSHPDKGSFILEACGEIFGGDRGVMTYDDPRCRTLAAEVAHNLTVPEDCFQINPSSHGALWQGEGDEQRLAAEIDTSATWKAPVRSARRRVTSPRPDIIEIVDEIELNEARPATFYLNTPLTITVEGMTAIVHGTKALLTIDGPWAATASAGEYYCDLTLKPWNRLALTSAAATRHVLRTVLTFSPLA